MIVFNINLRKHIFLQILFYFILIGILSSCLTNDTLNTSRNTSAVPGSRSLPITVFSPVLTENAQLHVSTDVIVLRFGGYETNWVPGTVSPIPAGSQNIIVRVSGMRDLIHMQPTFLPGKSYMIDHIITEHDVQTTRVTGHLGTTTTTTIYTEYDVRIREYGVTNYAVPGRNESLVEIRLGTGTFTYFFVNGYFYRLSSYERDAAKSVRFILPAGYHHISSIATVNDVNLYLIPNRHIVYTINTREASWTKVIDQPLRYIGMWHFDIGDNRRVIFTFNTDGTGSCRMYNGNILSEGSGSFTYTATDTVISINNTGSPPLNMPYQISSDQNIIFLDNFLDSFQLYVGIR
jgi:hypothetical protein